MMTLAQLGKRAPGFDLADLPRRAAGSTAATCWCRPAERGHRHRRAGPARRRCGAQGPAAGPLARYLCRRPADGGRPTRISLSTAPRSGTPEQELRWKRGGRLHHRRAGGRCQQALRRASISRPRPRRRPTSWSRTSSRRWAGGSTALTWMAPATKVQAQAKLATFTTKIGYPEQWHDYSALEIRRRRLFGNALRADQWAHDYQCRQARRADLPLGMGHDPDDGQRLRQFQHGGDRLPGGDPAAAILRSQRRPGGQLWRDRRGHRP